MHSYIFETKITNAGVKDFVKQARKYYVAGGVGNECLKDVVNIKS